MASLSSNSIITVMFLLLSIALASTLRIRKVLLPPFHLPVSVSSLTDTNICDPKDVYKSDVWGPTQDCIICTYYCTGVCSGVGTNMVKKTCTPRPQSQFFCQCCSPPTLPCGQPGDTSTETKTITSNCADFTNWCKEECSDVGGHVVDDKVRNW
ncbi:hypothetical protein MKX01_023678 [Papaver californicum]|nr:hypothetical protein MKX01_023678 [Papaver californicum]